MHEAHDSEVFSYVQEYEDFDCNSMVFNDVLYSVRAHENLFSFVTCGFVAAKHGLAAARARIARSALFGFVFHTFKNMKLLIVILRYSVMCFTACVLMRIVSIS